MTTKTVRFTSTVFAALLGAMSMASGNVAAQEKMDSGQMKHEGMDQGQMGTQMDHDKMGQGAMPHEMKPGVTEASGTGVINSIDMAKNQINITHEPMPDLGWPKMTMDLPVTSKVDLAKVKKGETVTFKLKLGRDKQYRVTDISSAK